MTTADRILLVVKDAGVPDRKVRSTLASLCGISVQAVRDWFEGKTKNINHDNLATIAREYKVSIDWLVTGEGERHETGLVLDPRETEIITMWRKFPRDSQRLIMAQFRAVLDSQKDPGQS